MAQVILVPLNPLDLRPEDLEPLAEEIRRDDLTVDIRGREQRGYGVTWWEVLEIIIYKELLVRAYDIALDKAVTDAIDKITKKVKSYVDRRRAERNSKGRKPRPFSLTFRDEEGRELRSVEISVPEKSKGKVVRRKSSRSTTGTPKKASQKKPGTKNLKRPSQKKPGTKKKREKP